MESSTFSNDQLAKALREAEDMMERASLPLLVLDEVADAIKNDKPLYGDRITVGMFETNVTSIWKTVLDNYYPQMKEIEDGYQMAVEGVPVVVKVFKNKYDFLNPNNMNLVTYNYWNYFLPNPFEEYWSKRKTLT